VLPCAAMILLDVQAIISKHRLSFSSDTHNHLEYVGLALVLTASIRLGILSWRYRPSVEREESSCPAPLFY
jgi:hypothetical protein